VSDNVPLAQSSGRLSAERRRQPSQPPGEPSPPAGPASPPDPAPQQPAWIRYLWLWDAHFAVVATVAVVAILTEDAGRGERAAATALVAALAGWYLALGRRLIRETEPRRWWWRAGYQAGVLALLIPAASLVTSSSLVMFALVPQALMLWPLVVAATVVVALLAVTWVVAPWLRAGELPPLPGSLELVLLLTLVMVLGFYINRIAQQSSERAQLIARLDASRAEVARLSHEAGVAAERQRLAGDIHDTIAQGLASMVMLLQSADAAVERDPQAARRHLSLAMGTARENLGEARALVAALTPAELDGGSLPEALRRLGARCRTGAVVTVSGPPRRLPTAVDVVLLRVAQESLTNVDKHAAAGSVGVTLVYDESRVALEVADDGAGFEEGALSDGYGLGAMRARVAQVAGTLVVDSAPGRGTTVWVTVPA
jgi:signal transduction histidine kinase